MQTRAQREWKERRDAERASRADRIGAQRPPATLHRAEVGGSTTGPAAKTSPARNPTLLEMARGRPCLFRVAYGCEWMGGTTTVACHSNSAAHGKSTSRKANDEYSVWGCFACHTWTDQGPADKKTKQAAFMAAHLRQVLEWRRIAGDPSEPERFRKAARWALERLNATEVGEVP